MRRGNGAGILDNLEDSKIRAENSRNLGAIQKSLAFGGPELFGGLEGTGGGSLC